MAAPVVRSRLSRARPRVPGSARSGGRAAGWRRPQPSPWGRCGSAARQSGDPIDDRSRSSCGTIRNQISGRNVAVVTLGNPAGTQCLCHDVRSPILPWLEPGFGRGRREDTAVLMALQSPTSRSTFCGSPTRSASISMPRSGARPRATRRSTRPKRPGARRRSTTDCSGSKDPGGFSRRSRGAVAERRAELRAMAKRVPARVSRGSACISRRFSVLTRPVLLR